jgi:hypothetical protein
VSAGASPGGRLASDQPLHPTRILVFQNRFLIGGQERQTVLNVRTMDRSRFQPGVTCLHLEGEHLEDLSAAGVRPVFFDVGRRMLRPRTAWQVARLAGFLRAQRIALVHAQDVYTNALGLLAARAARVPAVVTRVDLGHHVTGYRRPLTRYVCRTADRVVVNALRIRELVARQRPDVRLALVGDGVRRPLLERLAEDLGIAARVHFLGFRRDGAAVLARAALAVSASHAEGISNAILEAMARRLPVVATAVGGTPELVRDGVNGYLVPPGAPGALARRIADALADPARARRMGARGRRVVEREFDLGQMRMGYDALYADLVAHKVPRLIAGMG